MRNGLFKKVWMAAALVVFSLGLAPLAARAQTPPGLKMDVQAGYGGFCRANTWIPIRVSLENSGADLSGRLEVQQTPPLNTKRIYAQEISLPVQSRKTVTVLLFPENYLDGVIVHLFSAGKEVSGVKADLDCLSPTDRLFGVLGDASTPFNVLGRLNPPSGRTYVAQLQAADLPEDPAVLEAFDTLIVSGADTGTLAPAQQSALAAWVAGGGRMVVAGGPAWQRSAAGLKALLPLQPEGTQSLADLSELARFSGRSETLDGPAMVVRGGLQTGTQILAGEADAPLIAVRPMELGEVVYLTFDPAAGPFAKWAGREDFYRKLFDRPLVRPDWAGGFQNWESALTAVNSLPNLQLPHPLEVIGFLLVYVAVIGPVNFFVLRRVKHRELAWATIPVLALAFSGLAFGVGSFGRGKQPVLTRLAVVQAYTGEDRARVDGLVGLFSPGRSTYSLQIGKGILAHPIPENSVPQGLQTSRDWDVTWLAAGDVQVRNIHVDIGAVEAVAVVGSVPTPELTATLDLSLNSSDAVLRGEINNNSRLTLEHAVLLAPGSAQELGTLAPGSRTPVETHLLMDNQATYAGNSQALAASGLYKYYGPGYPGGYSWMTALTGGPDYYSSASTYQRYSLLTALAGYTGFSGSGTQGQIYLAGWSSTPLIDAGLGGQKFTPSDLTLYLVRLDSNLKLAGGQALLQPGMFTWSVLDSSQPDASPYNFALSQGSFSLAFRPAREIAFHSVKELTLHLANHGDTGQIPFKVSLWDFEGQEWTGQDTGHWGNYSIASPQKYVSPEGEVRLHIENTNSGQPATFERVDLSILVEP
ncbi:MAG TPA: hypothetical protein VMT46_00860 [Anaerolineaceae bacterium]|nr:hypothetical protein [Anaerolineaceae bacterium]